MPNSKLYNVKTTLTDGIVIDSGTIEVPQGEPGTNGLDALEYSGNISIGVTPVPTLTNIINANDCNRTPIVGDKFILNWKNVTTGKSFLCGCTITQNTSSSFWSFRVDSVTETTGAQGPAASGPEIPTPTTSDNGKVLGVANGAYALQEASGGGKQLYTHVLCFISGGSAIKIYLTLINDNSFKYTDFINAVCAVLDKIDGYNSPETYIYPATGYESEGQKIYGIAGSYDSSDVEVNLIVYVDSGTKVSHNNLSRGWTVQDIVTEL